MEKQRSFSMKPAKFLVFTLTISSSLIFLTILFIWVIKATPSFNQETRLHLQIKFNQNALSSASGPLLPFPAVSQTLTHEKDGASNGDLSASSISRNTNFFGTDISVSDAAAAAASQSTVVTAADGLGNLNATTSLDKKFSAVAANNNIFRKPGSTSGILPGSTLSKNANPNQDTEFDKLQLLSKNRTQETKKNNSSSVCEVTNGKWVFDESYPLYRNTTCPFIDEGFNCEANGRLDKDYMKWRWQPQGCDIPRFNASKMLELIRGKRLVFVGDSLNRNQWESMLCLLMGAVKDPNKVYETHGRRITKSRGDYCFKFVDYRCTVEFYVTHYLVHESKARIGKKRVQTLRIDTIDKGSSRWRGADILIFNTAHWWSHHKAKAGINYYQEGNHIHPRLEFSLAFRRALTTWASWVEKYVNPRQTRVFFRSSAPSHFSGGQWNTGGHCKEASLATTASFGISPVNNGLVEEVIRQMKTPVTFLNISGLSSYRMDGHPSIYGRKSEKSNFSGVQDCSHWCLPGVPDSWNELLYYHLLFAG